jgi:hypothetical protein
MPLSSTNIGYCEIHSLLGAGGVVEVYLLHETQLDHRGALSRLCPPI